MSIDDTRPSRRKEERRTTYLDASLFVAESAFDCKILNISVGGAKIEIGRRVEAAKSTELSIGSFGRFPCRVIWQNDEVLGLVFLVDQAEMAEVVIGLALYG